ASGGTTTAMTYTWTVSGANYTTTVNSYPITSISAPAAYTVNVKNANNCESNTASGNITVNYPGTNGQSAHATCGCATGTTNCSGTCKTEGNTTTNDGACTGACKTAYTQQRNACGTVINAKYSTYTNTSCTTPNYTTDDGACTGDCNKAYTQQRNACGTVINAKYSTYTNTSCTTPNYTTEDGECTGNCNTAYVQQRNACGTVINSNYGTYTKSSCTAGCSTTTDCSDSPDYVETFQPTSYATADAECKSLCGSHGYSIYTYVWVSVSQGI
ncbi:MAG: hypothetical protein LBD87_01500, partial [Prevotellaceae bacterium]|nr:hypothetical protein [Prevotellaceae bacterium]